MSPRVLAAVAVVAVALVVAATVLMMRGDEEPVEAGISGLVDAEALTNTHVERNVDYDTSPPMGGDHFPAWLECGAYDAPVADEIAVHNLEHGGIWIAYDADVLDAGQVATLADRLPSNGIMTPYDDLGVPVVVSAWERQVPIEDVADPRLDEFVEAYENGALAPESGQVTCAGGVSLADADAIADEYGL